MYCECFGIDLLVPWNGLVNALERTFECLVAATWMSCEALELTCLRLEYFMTDL